MAQKKKDLEVLREFIEEAAVSREQLNDDPAPASERVQDTAWSDAFCAGCGRPWVNCDCDR